MNFGNGFLKGRNKMIEQSLAEQLHDAYVIIHHVEDRILDAFQKFELDELDKLDIFDIDFHISSDPYDNSIEIYIDTIIPYPWEPCWDTRKLVYDMGFDIVYWNLKDNEGKFTEEIRGTEPRRFKDFKPYTAYGIIHNSHIHIPRLGYVDDRFDQKVWVDSKFDCRNNLQKFKEDGKIQVKD
jgi:hypothetical protein